MINRLYRLSYFCLSSSAGSTGNSLASQSSHLNKGFLYCNTCGRAFFPFPFFFRRRAFSYQFLFSWGFFLCTNVLRSSIYRKHSTAQSALHKAAKQLRADQSATMQAIRQSWREMRASMSSSICTGDRDLKKNEKIQICPAYINIQPLAKQLELV